MIGNSFAGAPFVIVGHNQHLAWGATVDPVDVTDVFQEKLVPDPTSPSGLSTVFQGQLEHVVPIPERYLVNQPGDGVADDVVPVPNGGAIPAATLIVPRRNQGPLVQVDLATGIGLSVQYTGFSGTRELDAFLAFDAARDLRDFQRALQSFDVGSQNFCYADDAGNIAYFAGAEVPVREDLQQGRVAGLPPYFIRSGTGGNEWLPEPAPPANGVCTASTLASKPAFSDNSTTSVVSAPSPSPWGCPPPTSRCSPVSGSSTLAAYPRIRCRRSPRCG